MRAVDIAFTVIAVSNLAAARAFYETILGLTATSVYEKDGMGMVEYEVGSATLAIGAGAPLFRPAAAGAVAFEVEDFDSAVRSLQQAGVTFLLAGAETPVCQMAVFCDPDGNRLMLHKRKPGRG